ncbi:serine hydroxymethyltransferase [Gordonia soli]|uniref:Serine hydroxymethyltransferase n=1 Tax=Gordonia soli NBRC 108243 TaxID=1223545 RepID=M0QQZ7_9ACTN|nr:serine hydroxymethyltransferase [Gordonia soli]GAC70691.1 serine hydroxymethyltransferase [Gordonia soli NBRC 108243]
MSDAPVIADPAVADLIDREHRRRAGGLQLLAAETPPSDAVRATLASGLGAKYAEGYPGARYHGGCEIVDEIEELAIARAVDLFDAQVVDVQPHSGSAANLAALAAFAQPGDPILALRLAHGGHQTHGSRANFSGRWFQPIPYSVRRSDELLDYDEIRDLALLHRPRVLVVGSTSYTRPLDYSALRAIADEAEAVLWVDAAQIGGLIAGGVATSPVGHADVVTIATHKVLRGPRGGAILAPERHRDAVRKAVFPFAQGGPAMDAVAAKAVAFGEAGTPGFAAYTARTVANARALVAALATHDVRVVSGGTDTHFAVADLSRFEISGVEGQARLAAAGIVVDKAVLPFDPRPVVEGSAIRLGTVSLTVDGWRETDMATVAEWIVDALSAPVDTSDSSGRHSRIRAAITDFRPR